MGDWDDDEFEVPTFTEETPAPSSVIFEEEDETVIEAEKASIPAPPTEIQIQAAKKRAQQEAEKEANRLAALKLENETPEERRRREKFEIENADVALAGEFIGSGKTGAVSIGSSKPVEAVVPLKTIRDHQNFATATAAKLNNASSTTFNIGAFYCKLTNELKSKLPIETLEEIKEALSNELEEKRLTSNKKKKAPLKTKKEIRKENDKHADVFGGDFEDDEYAGYSNIEDDFM